MKLPSKEWVAKELEESSDPSGRCIKPDDLLRVITAEWRELLHAAEAALEMRQLIEDVMPILTAYPVMLDRAKAILAKYPAEEEG